MKNKVSLFTPNKSSQSSNFQFGCAIVVMSKQAMASVILSLLHRYLLLALDGDIHLNPGPVPAQNLVSSPQGNSCFSLPSRGLRIGQWNINRLNETKFEQVQIEILGHDYNEKRLDVLIINKTFLNSQTSTELFNIPGFDLYIRNRNSTSKTLNGGGIAIYVNRDLIAKRRHDLETIELEVLWMELCPFKSKRSLIIGGIYRPPNSDKNYDVQLGMNIENASMQGKETLILGDFIIDYLDTCSKHHRLVKCLLSLSFQQHIIDATRPISGKVLDHIWSNRPEFLSHCSTADIFISDHLPVCCLRRFKKFCGKFMQTHTVMTYRDMKNFDEEKFRSSLQNVPWNTSFIFDDIEDIVIMWYSLFNNILDQHAPLISKRIKKVNKPKWLAEDISSMMRKRDMLLKKAIIHTAPKKIVYFCLPFTGLHCLQIRIQIIRL